MKYLIIIMTMFLSGCLILLDEDCDPYSVDYSHSEWDCYTSGERVEVCNRHYCWDEYRNVEVCDEYHVCDERYRSRNRNSW